LAAAYLGAWFAYFAFASSQFYRGSRAWSAARGFVAALSSQATVVGLVMAVLYFMSR
jgi:hypothetical protein